MRSKSCHLRTLNARATVLLLAGVLLGLPLAGSARAEVVDQQQTSLYGWMIAPFQKAQTFTAGVTGNLTRVTLPLSAGAAGLGDHLVEIQTTDGTGAPSGTVLGSGIVPDEDVPVSFTTASWIDVPITQAPAVTQGELYATVLHKNPSGTTSFAWWTARTLAGDFYPAGQRWELRSSSWVTFPTDFPDFGFQTYVEPTETADVDVLLDAMRNEMGVTSDAALRSPGVRTAFLSRLDDIDAMIDAGLLGDAAAELADLRRRMDGCGAAPDTNDWITDCTVQQELRALLDSLVVLLAS